MKLTRLIPPRSLAATITWTRVPGSTRAPVVVPVMATVGVTASSTVMAVSTEAVCPRVSRTVAVTRTTLPGGASGGMLNPNLCVRVSAAGASVDRRRILRAPGLGAIRHLRQPHVV